MEVLQKLAAKLGLSKRFSNGQAEALSGIIIGAVLVYS
jgi:hypothetical protein